MIDEREQIVRLTNKLIELPTVAGNVESTVKAFDLIDKYLKDEIESGKIVNKRYEHDDGGIISSIWGDPSTILTPELLLCGHIDVVKADEESQYLPYISGGRIYGRGSADMKGPDASMIVAFKRWIKEFGANNVSLAFTSDEEIGGFKGARWLIEKVGLRPGIVFIPDGDLGRDFSITESQKAPHHFRVIATGPGGHASRAFEIDNPINHLIDAYMEVREKFNMANRQNDWASSFEMTTVQSPVINIINPATDKPFTNHQEVAGYLPNSKSNNVKTDKLVQDLVNAKFNMANKIPSSAEAWFCWRWPLEQIEFKKGMAEIRKIFEKHGCVFPNDEHGEGEGCLIKDREAEYVRKWRISIENLLGREVTFTKMHGATDGRHFQAAANSEVLVTSVKSANAHGLNEWVDIQSLVTLSEAVYRYQREILK